MSVALESGSAFEARIERPVNPNGAGVLLLGGGSAHGVRWSMAGWVDSNGQRVRLTISGEEEADAPRLSRALAERGFVVMTSSTTPSGASQPTALGFEASVDAARGAMERLRQEEGVRRVYLVGHSLGATRAALIADRDVGGIVCLSGAYLSRTSASPRRLAANAPLVGGVDLDGDGVIRGWERAAAALERSDDAEFRPGTAWAIDRLSALGTPTLALFGGLDPISVHGPSLERLPNVEVEYLPLLGHQLGPEEDAEPWPLVGPIAPEVVERTVVWLDQLDRAHLASGRFD